MDASVRLDHTFVAMESANAVHAMLELSFPEAPGSDERAPLHVALVLDRSGSMGGEKLEATKACATHLVRRLRPEDELAIVAFDDEVTLVAGLEGVDGDRLAAAIDGIWPGGTTNLSGGWLKGLEELGRATGDGPRAVVLLTDGRANVGVVEPERLVAMTSGARTQGAVTSTIGFGDGFDEQLLSDMADAGGGNAHYAAGPEDAPAIFAEEFEGLASTVAQNVSVEIRPGADVEVLAVLNDHPATPVPGGVQLALGDAWGGDRRRIVFRLGIPAVAELGPRKVAEVRLRWTDVTAVPALHDVTVPVLVNVAAGLDVDGAAVDGAVVEEVVVLEAAQAEREARKQADEGDFAAARNLLAGSAARLREQAPLSSRPQELLDQAEAIDASGSMMAPNEWTGTTSKDMHYRTRKTTRRRKP
ncbi:MAG: hypothetical protein AVDCRST_MAG20-1990 [uncultured Acidimicrobiales bacterium]|uniref:VWFA domain-containing protein n=1 Tax=uncultured Acidimicrobiales bacterium TaxID=310071 RepID=A0A6J4IAV2_9ACTN|nr:MAG: hypothetical protein AVDCRST_MAG20-1990 [uncultured Acidimicrobiales bacterium]